MKIFNPHQIYVKPNWLRIFQITTLILAIILYFQNCTGSKTEPTVLVNKIDTVQENHIGYKNTIDSLEIEILDLQNELQQVQTNDKIYTKDRKIYVEKLVQMPFAGQQEWFDTNYKGWATAEKYNQLDSLQSVNIISDIENGKTAIARIGNFEVQIGKFEQIIKNDSLIKLNFEKDLEAHIIALDECEDYLHESQKKTWLKMNAGGSFGINKELNQFMYGGQLLFQGKKGHVTNFNYLRIGTSDYFLAGKSFKIFDIKR